MKIEILSIVNELYVNVHSEYGNFIGKWIYEKIFANGIFDVEVDFNEIISYEIIDEKYCIGNVNGINIICGHIVYEDNSVKYLDFGGDAKIDPNKNTIIGNAVIILDINEDNLKNKFLKLSVDSIELYPVFT